MQSLPVFHHDAAAALLAARAQACRAMMREKRRQFVGDAPQAEVDALALLATLCATLGGCDLAAEPVTAAPGPAAPAYRNRRR
jgi:hypothetical protein